MTIIPERIVELTKLLATKDFTDDHFDANPNLDFIAQPKPFFNDDNEPRLQVQESVMIVRNGSVRCNDLVDDMIRAAKPFIISLAEDTRALKVWISLMIPKVDGGGQFGVGIQLETLGEIQAAENAAEKFSNQISNFYRNRANDILAVAKFPHIEDFRRAVQEGDANEVLSFRMVVTEIRNRYCLIHDMVMKNLEIIRKPRRSSTHKHLY